jgi:hypothetical protein
MNLTIPELERRLESCRQYIAPLNTFNSDPEFFGYCKASVEYIPLLIMLLKLEEDRARNIQNDDLWQEIERLRSRIATIEAINTKREHVFPTDIEDTHYHKPDQRLVFEE